MTHWSKAAKKLTDNGRCVPWADNVKLDKSTTAAIALDVTTGGFFAMIKDKRIGVEGATVEECRARTTQWFNNGVRA